MFHYLDTTLANLLKDQLANFLVSGSLSITYVSPDRDFISTVTPPAINLFLYDVQENWELRSNEWHDERRNGRTYRASPPVRVDCSYLITAWTAEAGEKGAAAEHELLGDVMRVLLRHHRIPPEYLPQAWQEEPPLRAKVLQQGNLQSLGEFWQAMGGKPKAALHYTVTLSVPPLEEAQDLGPPVTQKVLDMQQILPPAHQHLPAAQEKE